MHYCDLPWTYLPSHIGFPTESCPLSLLAVTCFLLQPPIVSANLDRPFSCYPFQCNILSHNYLLFLPNYCIMLTVAISTRTHMQPSSIPVGDTCHARSSDPDPIPYGRVFLLQAFCSFASVHPCFYSYRCMHVHTHAWCYTRSMFSSLVSVAVLLRRWLTQRCVFLTNHGELSSSLMSACML